MGYCSSMGYYFFNHLRTWVTIRAWVTTRGNTVYLKSLDTSHEPSSAVLVRQSWQCSRITMKLLSYSSGSSHWHCCPAHNHLPPRRGTGKKCRVSKQKIRGCGNYCIVSHIWLFKSCTEDADARRSGKTCLECFFSRCLAYTY